MNYTQEDRQRVAKRILEEPLYQMFWKEMEATLVNQFVAAEKTDHDARAAYAAEIRAIRALQSKLRAAAQDNRIANVVTA